jgi:hypothetical protein
LGPRFSVDWSLLNDKESEYVFHRIQNRLPKHMRESYLSQREMDADILVRGTTPGLSRLVEVKMSFKKPYKPTGAERTKLLLQVIRLALVARQNGLAGVEYIFDAENVS